MSVKNKYKSARQLGYDDLFDEVCLQLKGNYRPENDKQRHLQCELINDVILIVKKLNTKK